MALEEKDVKPPKATPMIPDHLLKDRPISIGDRVSWGPVGEVKEGNVAFVGPVHFQQGIWVGVQVDEPGRMGFQKTQRTTLFPHT